MQGRARVLGVAVVVIVAAGCGSAPPPVAQPPAEPTSTIDKTPPPPLPGDGGILTPEDLAAQDRSDAAFFAKRAAFIRAFAKTDFDPATLPRAEMMVLLEAPPRTLQLAATDAEAIVDGTVQRLRFGPNRTVADVAVTRSVKGPFGAGDIVAVQVGMFLEPNQSFNGATLAMHPQYPPLFAGQEVVLLLARDAAVGWYAGSGAQAFPVNDGVAHASRFVPFRADVEGRTVDDLLDALK